MNLTAANYHSPEANRAFMSVSQYKAWLACPSAWLAALAGDYVRPKTKAFAVGSLFNALLLEPGTVAQVADEGSRYLLTKTLKETADAKRIYAMAEHCRQIPEFMQYLEGDHEVILTGQIGGTPWKAKLDVLNLEQCFLTDLKSAASLREEKWIPRLGARGNFVHEWDYGLQLAVYGDLAYQTHSIDLDLYLAACSKPTAAAPTPDAGVFRWTDMCAIEDKLSRVVQDMAVIAQDRQGTGKRCERCEWCRQTRTEWVQDIGPEPEGRTHALA